MEQKGHFWAIHGPDGDRKEAKLSKSESRKDPRALTGAETASGGLGGDELVV